jgi:hypothetical protein
MLLSGPHPDWRRRYWLAEPVELPAGSKLEVTAMPPIVEAGDPPAATRHRPQIAIDYVRQ